VIELNALLQTAPVALVVLDDDDFIRQANEKAVAMGLSVGTTLTSHIANLKEKFVDHVRHQPDSQLYRLEFQHGEKRCRASFEENNGDFYVWLVDVSEQLMLADQIRRLKHPDSRKMRQISQLSATAAGYSELLDVILADSDTLGSDKLNTVRQSVLVADQNDALTELISELLRDEGYKVVGFSDPDTALKYFRVNEHSIQKAVVDEGLICENDASLVATLQTASPDLGLIVLSEDSDSSDHGKVSKPLDFQVLLEAMED
jgi:CheY-like chemotaxis protein